MLKNIKKSIDKNFIPCYNKGTEKQRHKYKKRGKKI